MAQNKRRKTNFMQSESDWGKNLKWLSLFDSIIRSSLAHDVPKVAQPKTPQHKNQTTTISLNHNHNHKQPGVTLVSPSLPSLHSSYSLCVVSLPRVDMAIITPWVIKYQKHPGGAERIRNWENHVFATHADTRRHQGDTRRHQGDTRRHQGDTRRHQDDTR